MEPCKRPLEYYDLRRPNDLRLSQVVHEWDPSTPIEKALSRISFAILGWPDDRGIALNHGRKGARQGPEAIRSQFYRLTPGIKNLLGDAKILDLGNLRLQDDLSASHEKAAGYITKVAQAGVVPITLGGGNDYAYADVVGLRQALGLKARIGVINIDAHFDVRDVSEGPSSGTPYYRLLEAKPPTILGEDLVEFGIQPQRNSPLHFQYLKERKATVMQLDEIKIKGIEASLSHCLKTLDQNCDAIVVSLDIDSVCQADAPGCSAPSPNGLTAQDVELIAQLSGMQKKTKLFSIYEVSPPLDRDHQTSRLAASAIWFFIQSASSHRL